MIKMQIFICLKGFRLKPLHLQFYVVLKVFDIARIEVSATHCVADKKAERREYTQCGWKRIVSKNHDSLA